MSNESFTIFENDSYKSKKNLMFAKNFEATSIKVDSFIFSYATHLTFAQNFEATKVE